MMDPQRSQQLQAYFEQPEIHQAGEALVKKYKLDEKDIDL